MAIALARLGCQVPGDWLSCLLQQFTRRSGDARAHDYVSLLEVTAQRSPPWVCCLPPALLLV
jgi:hypothetical protein